ncbi:hypothetical protein [Cryptosporangium japonicum]|uniref:hypothetical protein n=1 Tax=Cryptosporangium japonicum TaxID=80872 RepID=UPI0031DF478E
MTGARPPLISEAAALSVAGDVVRRHALGSTLVGTGADATVVVVAAGDRPGDSGVRDSTTVVLRGDPSPDLHPRFMGRVRPPIHVFVRLEHGCLPLGTARCRRGASEPARFTSAELQLEQPLSRALLDAARPVPPPGPVPSVEWVDHVATDPIRALESFVLGWFPAGELTPVGTNDRPDALAAFHRLARLRPALHRFPDPVLTEPTRASGPPGDRLVFAVRDGGGTEWSIPWPPGGADPRVWFTDESETILEEEPLSRFLLQFTLDAAVQTAPYQATTYVMPTAHLDALRSTLRPVPLSPFRPTCTAARFFLAPGLLAQVSGDDDESIVGFGALHRGTLTPLLAHGFRWSRFDG